MKKARDRGTKELILSSLAIASEVEDTQTIRNVPTRKRTFQLTIPTSCQC